MFETPPRPEWCDEDGDGEEVSWRPREKNNEVKLRGVRREGGWEPSSSNLSYLTPRMPSSWRGLMEYSL